VAWTFHRNQKEADLIWVRRREIYWDQFDAKKQLANKIKKSEFMTTKGHLAGGLNAWFKDKASIPYAAHCTPTLTLLCFSPQEFVHVAPRAWRLYDVNECNEFFNMPKVDQQIWIAKATHLSRGRGIEVHGNLTKLREKYFSDPGGCKRGELANNGEGEVAQQYIPNPLLLRGHKSETRAYWVVVSVHPWIVLYHPGHVRITAEKYSHDDFDNIFQHIVNYDIQKHHHTMDDPEFANDRKWTLERTKNYLQEQGMTDGDWAEDCMKPAQKRAILTAFNATKDKLMDRQGTFSLYGADFIVDDTLKVWLTEIQIRPALALTGVKRKFLPRMLKEMLHIAFGIQKMKHAGESLKDISHLLKNWQVIANDEAGFYYHKDGPDTPKCAYKGPPKAENSIRHITKDDPPKFDAEGRVEL